MFLVYVNSGASDRIYWNTTGDWKSKVGWKYSIRTIVTYYILVKMEEWALY